MHRYEEQGKQRRAKNRRTMDLKCLTCQREGFHEAVIRNACEDGLYLECDHELSQGESIRVHLLQQSPGGIGCSETNECTGTVRWCRCLTGARRRYGAGVRYS